MIKPFIVTFKERLISVPLSREKAVKIHFKLLMGLLLSVFPSLGGIAALSFYEAERGWMLLIGLVWVLVLIIERLFKLISEYKEEDEKEQGICLQVRKIEEREKGV